MKDIDSRGGERPKKALQLPWRFRELHQIVLLLPLREPKCDGKVRANLLSNFLDDLTTEPSPRGEVSAIGIRTAVRAFPEKLVDQISVSSVNLQAIESQLER